MADIALSPPAQNMKDHFGALQGPWIVGVVLQSVLFGVLLVQAFDYFVLYTNDKMGFKVMVAVVVVLNLASAACDTYVYVAPVWLPWTPTDGDTQHLLELHLQLWRLYGLTWR